MDRRNFLKTVGAAGLGTILGAGKVAADVNEPTKTQLPQVPKRVFGKTGIEVSSLALGGLLDAVENQIVLRKAFEWGVTYWDSAASYSGGNNEIGIGKFFEKNPGSRENIFLVTKASGARTVDDVEDRLQRSLKRMNTDHIDLYYGVHVLNDISQMTDELLAWGEKAKKRGVIRYFGFSTHKNMAKNLSAGAKMEPIDGILTTYNFRVMQEPAFQEAIEACHKAGIGLTAMKTQALGIEKMKLPRHEIETEGDKNLVDHFLASGFTAGQTKIKVVLEDKRISSVTVGCKTLAQLTENVAGVMDESKLSQGDKEVLARYAQRYCSGYCAGCGDICGAAVPGGGYISDAMRALMYYNSYGDKEMAKETFAEIPKSVRDRMLSIDYSAAEKRCPQGIAIGKLMAEAVSKLA